MLRPAKAALPAHSHSVLSAERQSIPRLSERARKFTFFVWAPFVNAINSSQVCRCGLVQHKIGPATSARYRGWKSNQSSAQGARLAKNLEDRFWQCRLLSG